MSCFMWILLDTYYSCLPYGFSISCSRGQQIVSKCGLWPVFFLLLLCVCLCFLHCELIMAFPLLNGWVKKKEKKDISWHMKIAWSQISVSISKALLACGHAHSFPRCLWCSCVTMAKPSSCDREHTAHKATLRKYLYPSVLEQCF